MKQWICLLLLSLFCLTLGACVDDNAALYNYQPNTLSSTMGQKLSSAEQVAIFPHMPKGHSFSKLGKIHVATRNMLGFKRSKADIRQHMQIETSKLGGDAIIHPKLKDNVITAEAIKLNPVA